MNGIDLLTDGLLPLLAGGVLGAAYFGGLWLTIRRIAVVRHPAIWVLASYVLRTALLLGGLFFVMQQRWERLLFCVAGVVAARLIAVRVWGRSASRETLFQDRSAEHHA